MAQISVNIKCRICEQMLQFQDSVGVWGFLEAEARFMMSHDKCENLKEAIEKGKKSSKPGAKVGAQHANRSAKS